MDNSVSNKEQNIILKNREKLIISGVDDVDGFDKNQITAFTELGFITIKGTDLHIKKFNNQTKDLDISGHIDQIVYSDKQKRSDLKFLSRLFK